MHPAPSVIIFTSFSGLGFGLLFFLGLGFPPVTGWVAFVFYAIAYALAVGGLLASTFHLGNPQRALKAFSQWKTSWLSREAWLSVSALLVMAVYAFAAVFLDIRLTALGWIGAALSLLTVYSTSMIYGQLKTVPRWNQPLTPLHLLTLSIAGGALLAGQMTAAAALLALAAAVQVAHWQVGDSALRESGTTLATATGLGTPGSIRAFEPPHTGTNYLLKEFVHVVGRRHSRKLRMIALTLGYGVPVILLIIPGAGHVLGLLAVISHVAGLVTSRWLFFAEAEHVVGLYYGKRSA
jgi:DMSO reductase anchor subunit